MRELIAILNVALEGVNGLSPHILCYSAVTMAAVTSPTEPLLSDDRAIDWMGNLMIFFQRISDWVDRPHIAGQSIARSLDHPIAR